MNNGSIVANDTVENIIKLSTAKNFEDAFLVLTQKESANE